MSKMLKVLLNAVFAILVTFGMFSAYEQLADRRGSEAVASEPGRDVQVSGAESRAVIQYEPEGETLHLKILIISNDPGSEVIRTHVRLSEGQRHAVHVAADDASSAGEGFEFHRRGGAVFARAVSEPKANTVTTAQSGWWF